MSVFTEKVSEVKEVISDETLRELRGIELKIETEGVTLADLVRIGAEFTDPAVGTFGDGQRACALTAASVAHQARK